MANTSENIKSYEPIIVELVWYKSEDMKILDLREEFVPDRILIKCGNLVLRITENEEENSVNIYGDHTAIEIRPVASNAIRIRAA